MKQFFLLAIFFSSLLLQADPPQLTWRIANPRIITVTQQRLEFEVQVKANQSGTYYSSGQFMLYFNNDAISYSSDLHWTVIASGISAQTNPETGNDYVIARVRSGAYPNVKVLIGLSPTDEAVINEDPTAGYLAEITTEWQTYVKIQCRITDLNAAAGIYFDESGTNGQNFYLESIGNEVGYYNPSLYEPLTLTQANLGRLYSNSFGWSQYGGATDNVPFLDWTTSVNTSAWEGNPLIDGTDYQIQDLRIHNGANLSIQPDASLTVNGTLSNETGVEGLKLLSSITGTGSLIHTTDNVNATTQRYLTGNSDLLQQAYHLVSVPITTGAISGLFMDSYLYKFDSPTQSWVSLGTSTTTPLSTDQGYMAYYPGEHITYEFPGILYNGIVPLAVSYHSANGLTGFNLVPNPYPSTIDWDSPTGWTKTNINDAIWIWNPVFKNYSTYGSFVGTNGATQYIPIGQSFFVKANATGPALVVNNASRLHTDQAFYKNTQDEENLLRIKAFANQYQDELVIRLLENSSENYDPIDDRDKMFGADNSPQLYSKSADSYDLTLNTYPLATNSFTIPVSFKLDKNASVTLQFENTASLPDIYGVFLEDMQSDELIDVHINSGYNFENDSLNSADRFLLHFLNITSVNKDNEPSHQIWSYGDNIYYRIPNCLGEKMNLVITDMLGRKIIDQQVTIMPINNFKLNNYIGIAIVNIYSQTESVKGKVQIIK